MFFVNTFYKQKVFFEHFFMVSLYYIEAYIENVFKIENC